MSITEIKIRKLFTEGRLKAIISLVLNDCIAVHEIKLFIIEDFIMNLNSNPITQAETVELLTINECIQRVKGLSTYTLRKMVNRNEIPYIRAGEGKRGKILIFLKDLIECFGGKKNNYSATNACHEFAIRGRTLWQQ